MKPLVRWTIGFDKEDSYKILKLSISNFYKLYGDTFDYAVCYNKCNVEKIKMDIDLILIDQTKYMETLKVLPFSTSWKLYPPRIRLTQHEIFLDNDVVIYKKIPLIDEFLKSKKITFATEAKKRNYGNFDKAIPEKTLINTGLFGLPPYFDIKSKINEILKDGWNNWYDEQGLIASILFKENNFKIISINDIFVCFDELKFGQYGIHFVGLNINENKYWTKHFKNFKL